LNSLRNLNAILEGRRQEEPREEAMVGKGGVKRSNNNMR